MSKFRDTIFLRFGLALKRWKISGRLTAFSKNSEMDFWGRFCRVESLLVVAFCSSCRRMGKCTCATPRFWLFLINNETPVLAEKELVLGKCALVRDVACALVRSIERLRWTIESRSLSNIFYFDDSVFSPKKTRRTDSVGESYSETSLINPSWMAGRKNWASTPYLMS